MQECCQDAAARVAYRMPERDCTAVNVYLFLVEAQFHHHPKGLHRKRLVEFEKIDVFVDNHTSLELILRYYAIGSIYNILLVSPIAFLLAMVIAYLVLMEVVKRWFYRRYPM